jgi:diguanylate cyclase (GGDEF)-like protein/PAS domain S-box-containing protein
MPEFANPEIFRLVLEELLTGVYLVDCEQKVHFWNSGAERITGYLCQEMIGRPMPENTFSGKANKETDAGSENSPLIEAIREGKPIQADAYLRHKQGHRVPVRLRAIPIRNGQNRLIGAAACFDENTSVSEWNRRRIKLAEFGCIDDDTGVPNIEFILTQLRECLDSYDKHHIPFGVLCIEVDRMDDLHASYGQIAVESIMRVVAQTLENSLRPADWLGRWTDKRFLAILTECRAVEFGEIGKRLQDMVSCSETDWWGDKLSVTVSFNGTAARQGDTIESLLERVQETLPEDAGSSVDCETTAQDTV